MKACRSCFRPVEKSLIRMAGVWLPTSNSETAHEVLVRSGARSHRFHQWSRPKKRREREGAGGL